MNSAPVSLVRCLVGGAFGIVGLLLARAIATPGFILGLHFNPQSLDGAAVGILGALLAGLTGRRAALISKGATRLMETVALAPLGSLALYDFALDSRDFTARLFLFALLPAFIVGAELVRRRGAPRA